MKNYDDENEHSNHDGQAARGFLAGVLIGGLAGAGTMLLLAPQSGQRTRTQIQQKGRELRGQAADGMADLRDQTAEDLADAQAQARTVARTVTNRAQKQADKLQKQAETLQQSGQEALDDQKARWAPVVEAGKKAVKGS